MDLRLLGPIELWHGDRQIPLGRRQQRIVLAILALEAGRFISTDRLIPLLWGDEPPPRARATLHTRMSEVRTLLATAVPEGADNPLAAHGGGYTFHISPEVVDAHRFYRMVAQSRAAATPVQARDFLREALRLWRGPAFGAIHDSGQLGSLGQSLESSRLTALETLFNLELQLSNHDAIVDELLAAAAANPERERLSLHVLTALHRAGRGTEALLYYEQWRHWLADELGIDPGPEVQQAYLTIVRGETATIPAPAEPRTSGAFAIKIPRTLPPDLPDFTARGEELEAVRAYLRQDAVVAISGPGGVGKTALTIRAAYLVRDTFPDGQLYADLRGLGDATPAAPFDVLGRFLRALGVDGLVLPDTMEDRIDLYRGLLAGRRVLVVLDNAATDEQIAPLIPGAPDCAVLVNGRAHLGVTFGARTIDLGVLSAESTVEMLTSIVGAQRLAEDPLATSELGASCGYLPLALRIAGARLAAKPHWGIRKLVSLLNDEQDKLNQLTHGQLDVRTSIALSYAGLDPDVRLLLRRLGDMALPAVSIFLTCALMDVRPAVAESLLEQLVDARLLDFLRMDLTGRPAYRIHDLIRLFAAERAIEEDSEAERVSARVRLYGAWLSAAETIYRHIHGGVFQNISGSTPRRPIDEDLSWMLRTEPLRWFDQEHANLVVTIKRAASDRGTAGWELAGLTSPLFQMRRTLDSWCTVLTCALLAARADGDRRGMAAMLYRMGILAADRHDYEAAKCHLQKAADLFAAESDRHGRGTALTFAAMIDRFRGDHLTAEKGYCEALDLLHGTGDRGGEAFVIRSIGQVRLNLGDLPAADERFEAALRVYERIGSRMGTAQTLFWQAMLRIEQGRVAEAQEGFDIALGLARDLGDRPGEAQILRGLGLCLHKLGQSDKARATLNEALDLVRQPQPTFLEAQILDAIASL